MQSANAYSHGFFLKATHTNPCPPSPAPSNSLRTLFSHSLSDTQVLYKVYDIIRLPTTRQADITSCRDRRGASSQHTSHKYTEAWTFTNTHMHTHMHTQMHQIQGNLDRILHICRVLNSKSTTHTHTNAHSPAPAWRIPDRSSMLQPRGHSTDYTSPSWWAHTSATFSQTSLFFLLLLLFLLLHLSLFCLTLYSPPGVSNLNTSPWVKPVPPLPASLSG